MFFVRRHSMKKIKFNILSLILILGVLGISPGIGDAVRVYAEPAASVPFTEQKVNIDADVPSVALSSSDSATSQNTAVESKSSENDEVKKREMSRFEQMAWTIGKALLPTLAVMAFSAAVVLPIGWIVAGSILIGAATAGITTFAYENRVNSFRDPDQKKEMSKIWRDVTIAAAVNGAMAPFSMATAGIAQAIGPVTVKSIVRTAAKAGVVSFAGKTVANVAKGGVINLWYDHYYNYDEKEKNLKNRIATLSAIKNRSPQMEEDLVSALKELDTITKEKYTWANFRKDEKNAAIYAGINGILGGAASKMAGTTDWAKIASSKLFGSTDKANLIANAVVSNPFAFASGAAVANVTKKELLDEIKYNSLLQQKYDVGSPAWQYYEDKIANLQETYKNTSLAEAGKKALISNAAMQTAVVGTALIQNRLFDLPSQKKQKIQEEYEKQDAKWQKANSIRQDLEVLKAHKPVRSEFGSYSEYSRALRVYKSEYSSLSKEYQVAKVEASAAQKASENQDVLKDIKVKVEKDIEFARQAELAKSLGQDSYLNFKLKQMKDDPEFKDMNDADLKAHAEAEIRKEYYEAARNNATKLAQMEGKVDRKDEKLSGKVETGDDGVKRIVVRTEDGKEIITKDLTGKGGFWWSKIISKDPAKLTQSEIDRAVRQAYNSADMVKPSAFRNEFINMRMNQQRADGMSDAQIEKGLKSIIDEANGQTLEKFGGSWASLTKAEILAAGLERAKYSEGDAPSFWKILDFLKAELPAKTISQVQNQFKSTVTSSVPGSVYSYDPIGQALGTRQNSDTYVNQQVNDYLRRQGY